MPISGSIEPVDYSSTGPIPNVSQYNHGHMEPKIQLDDIKAMHVEQFLKRLRAEGNREAMLWDGLTDKHRLTRMQKGNVFCS
jgi:hypothetical protein